MLFFRSEEHAARWCKENNTPQRPIISPEQLWHLSVTWYENRITAESRRPAPDEMAEIFAEIGLEGPFWDPKSDVWNSA